MSSCRLPRCQARPRQAASQVPCQILATSNPSFLRAGYRASRRRGSSRNSADNPASVLAAPRSTPCLTNASTCFRMDADGSEWDILRAIHLGEARPRLNNCERALIAEGWDNLTQTLCREERLDSRLRT